MQMETTLLKENLKKDLKSISSKVNGKDRMKIGLHLDMSFDTVNRYLNGNFKNNIETAETVLTAAKNLVVKK